MSDDWTIGSSEVRPDTGEVRRAGQVFALEPRTMRVLVYLAENAGRVVSVGELLDAVWKDVVVTQDSVYTSIADLRRALGDEGGAQAVIVNVPRRGYRLAAPVQRGAPPPAADSPVPAPVAVPDSRRMRQRRSVLALVVLLVVAAGGLLLWRTRSTAGSALPAGARTIAVLPFSDLSEQHDQQYLADGLAEQVLDELAQLPALHVIGRASSFQFHDGQGDARHIGEALGAAYLLQGSVRREAGKVRVNARLLSSTDGATRWAKTYEAPFADAFKVQDSIAADLARYLEVAVAETETQRGAMNPEAYELFLRGNLLLDEFTPEGNTESLPLLEQAARLDPRSARIQTTLALNHAVLGIQVWAPAQPSFAAARRHAQAALQLDPDDGVAHAVLAIVAADYDWDWALARSEMERALQLAPHDAAVLFIGANVLSIRGDWARGRQLAEELLATDPLSPLAEFALGGRIELRTGNFAAAERHLRRGLQIRPGYQTLRYFLGVALEMQGRHDDALAEAASLDETEGRDLIRAMALHGLGREREAAEALQQATRAFATEWPSAIAGVHAHAGRRDQALQWLERARQARDLDLWMLRGNPVFDGLEGDPRYADFLRRFGLGD